MIPIVEVTDDASFQAAVQRLAAAPGAVDVVQQKFEAVRQIVAWENGLQ